MWQRIKNIYHLTTSYVGAIYFGFPSNRLTVIGVTGSDGKTTTVHMIYNILADAGKQVSMISSVNAKIGKNSHDTGFHVTTPNAWNVQKYLKQAVDEGSEYFVLETTSHGLDQNRVANINFKIAGVTNIIHEHFDYHKNWLGYATAKAKLFRKAKYSILNLDDKSFNFLKSKINGKIITYSKNKSADYNLKKFPIKLKILGDYNLSNALASTAICSIIGISKQNILKSLSRFKSVKGRMEEIKEGQNFKVVVDFAHTPNSLKEALITLKAEKSDTKARLIAVFGSAGQRDKLKRGKMGKIASDFADISVLTAEDPRTEDAQAICRQIAASFSNNKKQDKDYYIIPNRKEAIDFAIKSASSNDVIGIFGKSHERSMTYGTEELPWDEFKEVRNAIKKYAKK